MVWWGVDVVVGVIFPVFCVQNGTWRAVWGVGVVDMVRLCFPIAAYSMYMGMGDGAGGTPVARLGGCGLCAWGPGAASRQVCVGRPQGAQVGVWEADVGDCLRSAHVF